MGDKVPTVEPFAAALGLYRASSPGSPLASGDGHAAESEVLKRRWGGFVRWLVEIEDSDELKQLRSDEQRSARRRAQLHERFEAAATERLRITHGEAAIERLDQLGALCICRWCPECEYSAQVRTPTAGVCRGDSSNPHAPVGIRHTTIWRP